MNVFLLMPAQVSGFLWLLFLFAFCFFGVHIAKLAGAGWEQSKGAKPPPQASPKPAPEPPQKEKKPEPPQEPVYYIVERKKRKKPTYGEPKKISFSPPKEEEK